MKALSIQQPWAWAILHAGKNIENRTWQCGYRGPVLIHAGKKYDDEGADWISSEFGLYVPREVPLGGVVGRVDVVGYIQFSDSRWFAGPWGWLLANAEPVEFVPCRGQLGLFDVEWPA